MNLTNIKNNKTKRSFEYEQFNVIGPKSLVYRRGGCRRYGNHRMENRLQASTKTESKHGDIVGNGKM
jgi:hypothetical protein